MKREKSYIPLAVNLINPDDADLIEFFAKFPRGTVGPWIKKAIREYRKQVGDDWAILPPRRRPRAGGTESPAS